MFNKILSFIFLLFFSLNCSAGLLSADLDEKKITTSSPEDNFFLEATLKYPKGWYIKTVPQLDVEQGVLVVHPGGPEITTMITNPENGEEFYWMMKSGVFFKEGSDAAKTNRELTAKGALDKTLVDVKPIKRKFAETENKKNYDVTTLIKEDDGTESYTRILYTLVASGEDQDADIYLIDVIWGADTKGIRESIDGFKRECTPLKLKKKK